MYLIVGLGNPGSKYTYTRHNAGFLALEKLAAKINFDPPNNFGRSLISRGRLGVDRVILAWPQTFMNLSGEAVQELSSYFKISPEHIMIIYDEMDIEHGRLKISVGGSAGGHNGIASVMTHIQGDFVRLKIGIGRPPKEIFTRGSADYVLTPFTDFEWPIMMESFEKAADAACDWLREGLVKVQGRVNRKQKEKKTAPKPITAESNNESSD